MLKLSRRTLFWSAIALSAASASAWAAANLDEGSAKAAIEKTMPGAKVTWASIQIASPRQASGGESSVAGMPYPVTVYPVRGTFTMNTGFKRDVTQHYFIYQDDFGDWTAKTSATSGNTESEPYN